MSAYVIEKGVPVPTTGDGAGLSATLRLMEVGDSVLITDKSGGIISCTFSYLKPLKFCRRKAEGGYRVWRIK